MKAFLHVCSKLLRLLPLLFMVVFMLWLLLNGQELSVETLLNYVPQDRFLAVLALWLAFAVKSLSLALPVMLLFALTGALFPLPLALPVNLVGIFVTLTIPYFVGRFSGPDMTERLMAKHPRLSELRVLRSRNTFFFAFIVRAIGVLPCDVVSLYMGNTRLPYPDYILGGVLGSLPDLVCATVLGMQIDNAGSLGFWITVAVNLSFCLGSALVYRAVVRRRAGQAGS